MHLHLEKKTNNYHCHGRLLTSEGFLAETRVKEETSTNHIYHILRILPVLAHNKIHHQVSRSSNTLTTKSQNQNPTPSQINLGCSFLNASTISVRVIFNHKARHKQHLIVKLRFFFLNICLVVKYTSKQDTRTINFPEHLDGTRVSMASQGPMPMSKLKALLSLVVVAFASMEFLRSWPRT